MSVLEGVWGCGWGEAGGWMPLPTRPQRYCDPASLVFMFLVADTQLYKRLCPSVRWSVGPSVRPSVRPSIRHGDRVEKWKNERFGYFLCMFVCGGGGGWGVDGGWMPLPTRPPRYCDPASLVDSALATL